MAQAAQADVNVPAPPVDAEEEMEVVPPHLDPVQMGAMVMQMQHTIAQLRGELNANRNQQLLGVQQQAAWVPQPEHWRYQKRQTDVASTSS